MNLGTDPEYFIVDKDGKPVPAHRVFGDKHNKSIIFPDDRQISSQRLMQANPATCHVKAFRDGYAVELNTMPAMTCRETLALYMGHGVAALAERLNPLGLRPIAVPAIKIDLANDLADAPPDVLTFGCDPSWDAYTGDTKVPVLDAMTHEWRYAGGHMHISQYTKDGLINKYAPKNAWMQQADSVRLFIRMCDLYLGIPLTVMFRSEGLFRRRQFYGQAGEFRYQEYPGIQNAAGRFLTSAAVGIEYRSPGPEIFNDVPVSSFAFGIYRWVAQSFETLASKWDSKIESDVQNAMNTGENLVSLAKEVPGFYSAKTLTWLMERCRFPELRVRDRNLLNNGTFQTEGWRKLGAII